MNLQASFSNQPREDWQKMDINCLMIKRSKNKDVLKLGEREEFNLPLPPPPSPTSPLDPLIRLTEEEIVLCD